MSLIKPPYIAKADIAPKLLDYSWDEWNVRHAYMPIDQPLFKRLKKISHRAQVGLTIAEAEWVVFRYDLVSDDPLPSQYLEAAWAANVDLAYAYYIETRDDDWRGPIRGPLKVTLSIVVDSLFCADESPNPAENPSWMSRLAEHLLPDHTAFQQWREACVQRLEALYPAPPAENDLFGDTDTGGPPVPREVFNPEYDFEPETKENLVNRYLAGLDYRTNPFLRSPEEMLEIGFLGIPYRFQNQERTDSSE
jgi:hypothetical protein